MDDFLEYDEVKKTIKSLNLDDFGVEELNFYVEELKKEILRVEEEINKKKQIKKKAEKLFG